MPSIKEIQDHISSIKETLKITNAMYMISSSKMKQAQKVLKETEPFFYAMQGAMERVLRHVPDIEHPYFSDYGEKDQTEKRIGYFVITADKGLAGAYNHNVIKLAEAQLKKPGIHKLYVLGELGRHYFNRKNLEINTDFRYTVQKPTMHQASLMANEVMSKYNAGDVDEFQVIFTAMNSGIVMEAQIKSLLPLHKAHFSREIEMNIEHMYQEVIAMSPSAQSVIEAVVPNILIGIIYGCLVEAFTSELNSRMTAMEAATKSGKDILKELSISYNRARQSAITQEITEVISGSKAQKQKHR